MNSRMPSTTSPSGLGVPSIIQCSPDLAIVIQLVGTVVITGVRIGLRQSETMFTGTNIDQTNNNEFAINARQRDYIGRALFTGGW